MMPVLFVSSPWDGYISFKYSFSQFTPRMIHLASQAAAGSTANWHNSISHFKLIAFLPRSACTQPPLLYLFSGGKIDLRSLQQKKITKSPRALSLSALSRCSAFSGRRSRSHATFVLRPSVCLFRCALISLLDRFVGEFSACSKTLRARGRGR